MLLIKLTLTYSLLLFVLWSVFIAPPLSPAWLLKNVILLNIVSNNSLWKLIAPPSLSFAVLSEKVKFSNRLSLAVSAI